MKILFNFIEMLFMLIFFNLVFHEKLKKKMFIYSVIALSIAIINTVLVYYIGISKFIAIVVISIILSKILSVKYNMDMLETLTEIVISSIVIMMIEVFNAFIIVIIMNIIEIDYIGLTFIVVLLFIAAAFIINGLVKKFHKIRSISKYPNINIILFNLYMFFMALLMIKGILQVSVKNLVQIIMLCISLIVVNAYYLISTNNKKELNKKLEINNNINPLIEDLLKDMKAKEHEYNNHLTVMYSMIQVCSLEELRGRTKNYLGEMKDKNQYLTEVAYIKNTIVQAIVYNKLKEAENYDITLNHDIDSDLKNIKLDDSELTVILSNLINNAIEAAKKQLNKEIDVYIGEYEGKYIIEVSNWIEDEMYLDIENVFKAGFSTKGKARGYGLHNIKNIIDKRKGKINVSIESNIIKFTVSI